MSSLFNWLSQIGAVTTFGLLGIPQRRGSVAAAVCGIAGVVAVLVGVLSIGAGFRRAMMSSGAPDTVIVLRSGADTEMVSGLSREQTRLIADTPGIVRRAEGPLSSAELFVIINLPKLSTGTDANVPLRGVERPAFLVRDQVRIVEGRAFAWGKNEVIVGVGASRTFAGLRVGDRLKVGRSEWPVVGVFSAEGGAAESEIWSDATVLQSAYQRGDSFQSVAARLESPEAFRVFKDALTTNPRLEVKVLRTADYYAEQSTALVRLITTLGYLVAALMAVGAVFGALNTMYSSVAARTREIATLRALGFGRGAVVVAVMLESIALALVGGALGAVVAYLGFNGFQAATVNWQSFSQVTFAFAVTPALLLQGVVLATVIGIIGGLLPAVRAARQPVAKALREL
ncbi:FtsX-like permease family protein [Opitutus sp. ER46]|uniref:ABC transporter permease n=1 Tax=Opitutus sp. ER46 TaxID=2161864 RepID=UPI000D2F8B46|nr:FtsX-like permease family protein [Opitutus sp. ER46]PTX92692.1 ABC transporter permease [Opitutus sp. ER46]